MQDGEVVTLTYSADIDTSKIPVDVNNNPTVVIGNNRVKVSNEYDPTPVEREVNTRIDYTPKIQKDGMVLNEDGETFDCRFTFNTDAAYSGANHQITDTLGEYLTLEGTTGARITIIDSEGNSTQQFLNWGESNPNFGTLNKAGGNDSFVYITPNIPGEYKYIVEYQVKVTGTEGLVEQITVSNTVQTDGDKSSTGTGTYTPATGELKLYKTANKIDYENKEVTWTVSIDVPETGLTEAYAELVDQLPQSGWIDEIGGSAWDTFVQDSETVTGLIGTESYTLVNDPANHKFSVNFKNSNNQPGLDAGQKRVVTVTFKTAIDPNWLDAAKTRAWLANHVNNVRLGTKTGSASVFIAGAGVTKTGELCGYRTVNGTRLPIYRFTLLLKNVTKDDNTIKDTFDRELLEPLYVDQLESTEGLTSDDKWYGWHTTNEYMSGVRSSSAVSYVDTPYGMDIITSADSMVHNSLTTTGFYEVTRIDYFLTVKDAAALKKIQDLAYADENNEYTFNNSAEWENTTGDVDVTYEYKGLKKELLTSDDDLTKTDENVTAQFRITLNPGGQTLNGGEPMTMTDTVTNLSVDVTTIQASPSAGVSWDMTGNTVTYVIPDSTQVIITYTATVIFDTIGEQGQTIDSTFSNVAEMKGYKDEIEKTAHRKNNGGGGGSVLNIHLLKYKKGDMTKTLQGAEFALLDADKNPIQDKNGNNVTFETDENGLITVEGDADAYGWTLFADTDYYLKEIKAPEGFVLKNTYYKFIICEDGLPDYDKNIYYSGDTMTCKNEKPGATLEVEKALGEDSNWPEGEIVVFTLQSMTEGAPMPESGGETVILSEPGKGTFGEIEYPVSDKEQTYEYKITESEGFGEGWTNSGDITATVVISPDDGSGNVTTTVTYSPENKTITNTKDEGGLVVSKKVVSAVTADKTKDFSFRVELSDKSVNGTYGEMTFTNGVAEFTLKDGETKRATGLAKGIEYKVFETAEEDFNTTSTGETGEIVEKETKKAEFTNTRKTGSLEISKTVVSPVPAEATKEFTFTIELSDNTVNGTFSDVKFTNGVAEVTVAGGSPKTIEGLPEGVNYTVTEAADNDFENTKKEGETGSITAAGATAAFENTRKTGELEVTKKVVSSTASDKQKDFSFRVTLTPALSGTFGGMTFDENGVAKFTLKGGETKSATGLPVGCEYKVEEDTAAGFVTTKTGVTGKISAIKATAAFTNTKAEGGLIVSKSVVSAVTADKQKKDFGFEVVLTDKSINGTYGEMTFENGVAKFTLKGGETKFATGLPDAIGYVVSESSEPASDFIIISDGATGNIVHNETNTAEFTNTRKTGNLEISKTVVSPVPAEKDANYTFTVTLTNSEQKISGEYSGYYFDENGQATVTVKGNASVTIEGLPVGTTYSVVESKYDNFDTESTGEAGDINDTKTSVAAFTNTRKTGSLEVTKTVANKNSTNTTSKFSFTVTLGDKTINGSFGDMTFNEGVAKFTLKDGEKAAAEGLPAGVSYVVEEANAEGFKTTKEEEAGEIKETIITASFTNTYLATGDVDLEVRKALEGRPLTDGQFGFELIGADGKAKQTKYCDSTGRVYFDRITYSQDDLQKNKEGFLEDTRIEYTVKEVIPADAADKGYTYDAEPKTITVTLHDNEDGTIKAEASPKPENVTFHNKYEAKGSIELNAGKILLGERALEKDKFEFELKDDKGKVLQRKKNDADGKVAFDAIEYTQDDIYEYDAATGQYKIKDKTSYEYKIHEVIPDDAVNADGTAYKDASEAVKKAGGFKKDGYTYDGTEHTITVELTDNGDGTINAKVAGSGDDAGDTGVVITNAYDSDGTLKLNAEKIFKNGTLKGGEFTFELMDAAGKVLQSKKNDAAGNVSFDMITYKLADVAKAPFTYTVREVPGSRTDVKYDTTVYTVTVELKDKGDGTLEVTKKIDNGGALEFENEQLNVETSVTIGGVKQLKGQTLKKDQFKFVLADENGKWLDTATNDAEGNFAFKPITYKLSDLNGEKTKVYSYSVWEVKGSESGITYDKTVYTVKVTVTDNGDGTMTAKADKAKSDIKFVNTTTEKKSKKTSSSKGSKTGDEAPLGVLFGGLGVGAIGLAVLLWNRKKKKDEE